MEILIFDMDGVLLEAKGYHRALQDTVRMVGEYLSLNDIILTQEQINQFEASGISSEWQSSALCMALLQTQLLSGDNPPQLDLEELFCTLNEQPIELPALERGLTAIDILCQTHNVDPTAVRSTVLFSENIEHSLTKQWFQEFVLGSDSYQARYQKPGLKNSPSYLKSFDVPILTSNNAEFIKQWAQTKGCGAAIMTNRPSGGPSGFFGSPEAELGLELVQLSGIPFIGYGEISWLASKNNAAPQTLGKPNIPHALAAILSSTQLEINLCLGYSIMNPSNWPKEILQIFQGVTISVFEDTPAGIISIKKAGEKLNRAGVDANIRTIGIATEKTKINALAAQGAQVYSDINSALSEFKYHNPLS